MAYEVLARKWRPQIFKDVIGQEHIAQTLMNAIKTDRLAHAYLFSGARGVGKTSVARILAKAINCSKAEPGIPCNECSSCMEITGGSSVDVQEIDGASNRGIDEIRELRENIKYMPSSSRYRIYIIDEVHMLTLPAFNALLKTLEEPPPHVKFIFATTEPHKVPVTILSRCQRFDFKRIPLVKIVEHLGKITAAEGIEISQSGLTLIAREAEGSMRDAQSLLDQVISFTGQKVGDKDITDILGIIDRELIFEASLAILEGAPERCVRIVDRIYNYGYDIKEFYRALMDQFRNLLIGLIASQSDLVDMIESDLEEIKRQADMAGPEKLQQSLNLLIAQEATLRYTTHPRLVLETIMIKLCRVGEFSSFDELIRKIRALEGRLSATSSRDTGPPADHLSDPGIAWEAGPPNEEPKGEDWDGLLNYVSSRNRAMANVLKELHLLKAAHDALEIDRGNNSFSSSYFDDPERLDRLTGYCRDFFKRDMKIRLVVGPKETRKGQDPPTAKSKEGSSERRHADLPPPVQDVLEVFQGQIRGEVPRPNTKNQVEE
jgi:DNA polymerase-3 subunit gamma/tau